MHFCICARRLFRGDYRNEVLKANAEFKIDLNLRASKHLNAAGLEFLGKLLSKDPCKRPSARDALGHRWFERVDDDSAVEVSPPSQALTDSSQYDTVFFSRAENEPKPHNRSRTSLFRRLLRRPGMHRSSTLTKILPAQTNGEHVDPLPMSKAYIHPPLSSHAHRSASGAGNRFTRRASELMAWVRGNSKQRSNPVSDEDITAS